MIVGCFKTVVIVLCCFVFLFYSISIELVGSPFVCFWIPFFLSIIIIIIVVPRLGSASLFLLSLLVFFCLFVCFFDSWVAHTRFYYKGDGDSIDEKQKNVEEKKVIKFIVD